MVYLYLNSSLNTISALVVEIYQSIKRSIKSYFLKSLPQAQLQFKPTKWGPGPAVITQFSKLNSKSILKLFYLS